MASGKELAAYLNTQLAAQTKAENQGILYDTSGKALGALGAGATGAKGDINSGLQSSLAALGSGYGAARGDITSGYGAGMDSIRAGIAGLDPYAASGRSANSMLDNALGLGGASGNAAATGAFQASPGYEYQVNQATDAAARKAAALGIAGSGNTLSAITTLGSNLANQEYGSWLDRLTASKNTGLTAANAQLGGQTSLAGLQSGQGSALGTLDANQGTQTAGLYTNAATGLGNIDWGLGQGQAGIYTGLGNSLTGVNNAALNTITNQFTNAGNAPSQSQATMNNILGGVGLGLKGLGALSGFGGFGGLSGLSGMFGGGGGGINWDKEYGGA